jgi:hypothetical protein
MTYWLGNDNQIFSRLRVGQQFLQFLDQIKDGFLSS